MDLYELEVHKARRDNPHQVTKQQTGLSEIQNYPLADEEIIRAMEAETFYVKSAYFDTVKKAWDDYLKDKTLIDDEGDWVYQPIEVTVNFHINSQLQGTLTGTASENVSYMEVTILDPHKKTIFENLRHMVTPSHDAWEVDLSDVLFQPNVLYTAVIVGVAESKIPFSQTVFDRRGEPVKATAIYSLEVPEITATLPVGPQGKGQLTGEVLDPFEGPLELHILIENDVDGIVFDGRVDEIYGDSWSADIEHVTFRPNLPYEVSITPTLQNISGQTFELIAFRGQDSKPVDPEGPGEDPDDGDDDGSAKPPINGGSGGTCNQPISILINNICCDSGKSPGYMYPCPPEGGYPVLPHPPIQAPEPCDSIDCIYFYITPEGESVIVGGGNGIDEVIVDIYEDCDEEGCAYDNCNGLDCPEDECPGCPDDICIDCPQDCYDTCPDPILDCPGCPTGDFYQGLTGDIPSGGSPGEGGLDIDRGELSSAIGYPVGNRTRLVYRGRYPSQGGNGWNFTTGNYRLRPGRRHIARVRGYRRGAYVGSNAIRATREYGPCRLIGHPCIELDWGGGRHCSRVQGICENARRVYVCIKDAQGNILYDCWAPVHNCVENKVTGTGYGWVNGQWVGCSEGDDDCLNNVPCGYWDADFGDCVLDPNACYQLEITPYGFDGKKADTQIREVCCEMPRPQLLNTTFKLLEDGQGILKGRTYSTHRMELRVMTSNNDVIYQTELLLPDQDEWEVDLSGIDFLPDQTYRALLRPFNVCEEGMLGQQTEFTSRYVVGPVRISHVGVHFSKPGNLYVSGNATASTQYVDWYVYDTNQVQLHYARIEVDSDGYWRGTVPDAIFGYIGQGYQTCFNSIGYRGEIEPCQWYWGYYGLHYGAQEGEFPADGGLLGDEHPPKTNNPHQVTQAQIGLAAVANYPLATHEEVLAQQEDRYISPANIRVGVEKVTQDLGLDTFYGYLNPLNSPDLNTTTSVHFNDRNDSYIQGQAKSAVSKIGLIILNDKGEVLHEETFNITPGSQWRWDLIEGVFSYVGQAYTVKIQPLSIQDQKGQLRVYSGFYGLIYPAKSGEFDPDRTVEYVNHPPQTNNPHQVTQAQIGLASVANYPMATSEEVLNNIMNRYISPKHIQEKVNQITNQKQLDQYYGPQE